MSGCLDCGKPRAVGSNATVLRCRRCYYKARKAGLAGNRGGLGRAGKNAARDGAGPLARAEWRWAALRAIETWEHFGVDGWTAAEWCARFKVVLRQWERQKLGWSGLLGLDLTLELAGVDPPPRYRFTADALDRLRLIRDLLDRYYAYLPALEHGAKDDA